MPKLTKSTPKYRKHRATGQAVVSLNGKDFYLGPHGTKTSKTEYDRLIGEWLANGRTIPQSKGEITVTILINAYWKFAKSYYVKDGKKTNELAGVKAAVKVLKDRYGNSPVSEFGPLALEAVRNDMIATGNSRRYINQNIGRIKRMFRWGVSRELIDVEVYQRLKTVDGLKKGKTAARDYAPILPIDDETIELTIKKLVNPVVADMIRIQRLTGCRPGEVMNMKPVDIDRDTRKGVWLYYPSSHKMQHKDRHRVIVMGPAAQKILAKYLLRDENQNCFLRRCKKPFQRWHYNQTIKRACAKANVEPWAPNRIRHTAATEIRKNHGLEAAQVVAGHAQADVTQIYAERDLEKAIDVMSRIG